MTVLRTRLLTASLLAPVVLGLTWLGGLPFAAAAALTAVLATAEVARLLHRAGLAPPSGPALLGSGGLVLGGLPGGEPVTAAALALLLIAPPVSLLGRPGPTAPGVLGWLALLGGVLYVGGPLRLLVALRGTTTGPGWEALWGGASLPPGLVWTLAALLGTWACDAVAYGVGRRWGWRRLAPAISPGKTIEGTVAGVLAATLVVALLVWRTLQSPWGLALGPLVGLAAVLGDLSESLLKRSVGVKDTGGLLPGHGGLLDRIDSLLLVTVVLAVALWIPGWGER